MHIDVVIPSLNGGKWIAATLDSVLAQSFKPRSVIVVDDGSTDGSPELVARRYADVILLRNQGKGCSSARNLGFHHTTSPLVVFLDCDDVWHPEHLRILRDALIAHPACGYAATWYKQFIDGRPPAFDLSDGSVTEIDPWDQYPTYGFARTPGTTLFRRETVVEAGAWNQTYVAMEDHDLWLRCSLMRPVAWCGAKTLAYRLHQGSSLITMRRSTEKYYAIMQQVYDDLMRFALASSAHPERKALIARRNAYIHDIIQASRAVQLGHRAELDRALRHLHEGLLREPWYYSNHLLHTLVNVAAFPCEGRSDAVYEACFLTLLDAYPGDFTGLKKILVYAMNNYYLGPRLYLRHLARRLWDLERVYPLAITAASSMRRWYRTVSRSFNVPGKNIQRKLH